MSFVVRETIVTCWKSSRRKIRSRRSRSETPQSLVSACGASARITTCIAANVTKAFCAVESQSAVVRDRVRAMLPPPTLRCRDLERYLGEDESRVHVLRGVSLDLEPGTVHAVVGPSGCGKSTLLYILGLLDHPDAGSVVLESIAGSHLRDDELARKRNELIGFIFQFHFLMEDFTAQENVMIPMRKLGRLNETDMAGRAAELLSAVGLGEKLERPSRHLSGGEQQRVAIARSLANNPSVIL